jgi:hypothetical protein
MPDGEPARVCWCGRKAGHSGKHMAAAAVSRPVGDALAVMVARAVERRMLTVQRDDLRARLDAVETRIAVLWAEPEAGGIDIDAATGCADDHSALGEAVAAAVRSGDGAPRTPEPSGLQDGEAEETEARPPEPRPAPVELPLVPIRKEEAPAPMIPFRRPHRANDELPAAAPPPPAAPGRCHCGRAKGHTGRHTGGGGPPAPRTEAEPPEPQDATYDQVARWAGQRGIAFLGWDDLPRVNRQRERHGLATFRRWFQPRGIIGRQRNADV